MRLRTLAVLFLGATAVLASACNGDDDPPEATSTAPLATSTVAPTSTPLARVPDPVVVTGGGLPGGGGSSEEAASYTVESGDTLGAIATRFGVDVETIRSANGLSDDNINIGQVLSIPRQSGAGGEDDEDEGEGDDETPPVAPGPGGTYTVLEGDTAFGIALQFDTTVEALAEANNMSEDEITDLQIGQVLRLPAPE
ncbi:MAG: LysM peptidoglycan-binding domain-containing protein [Dehalococcoidia bacterium]